MDVRGEGDIPSASRLNVSPTGSIPMTHRNSFRMISILTVVLFSWGCGSADRANVSGKVTLDGQPLETGSIAFEPIEGTQSPSAGADP